MRPSAPIKQFLDYHSRHDSNADPVALYDVRTDAADDEDSRSSASDDSE